MKVSRKEMIILLGSPRKNENSSMLAEEFKRGARDAGADSCRFVVHIPE